MEHEIAGGDHLPHGTHAVRHEVREHDIMRGGGWSVMRKDEPFLYGTHIYKKYQSKGAALAALAKQHGGVSEEEITRAKVKRRGPDVTGKFSVWTDAKLEGEFDTVDEADAKVVKLIENAKKRDAKAAAKKQ